MPAAEAGRVFAILEIGLHHEQQHQELILTDILHAFAQNPTDPVYDPAWQSPRARPGPRGFVDVPAGVHAIGHDGEGFCFDNETPRHDELIPLVRIARHLVTNAEWLEFIGPAATRRRRSGCRTAGPRCRRKAGRRPAIGGRTTAPGT